MENDIVHHIKYQNNNSNFNKKFSRDQPSRSRPNPNRNYQSCFRCGNFYSEGHNEACKANGKTCYKSHKKNYLVACCTSSRKQRVRELDCRESDDSEISSEEETFAVSFSSKQNHNKSGKTGFINLSVENVEINMMIDSGLNVNLIDQNTYD